MNPRGKGSVFLISLKVEGRKGGGEGERAGGSRGTEIVQIAFVCKLVSSPHDMVQWFGGSTD